MKQRMIMISLVIVIYSLIGCTNEMSKEKKNDYTTMKVLVWEQYLVQKDSTVKSILFRFDSARDAIQAKSDENLQVLFNLMKDKDVRTLGATLASPDLIPTDAQWGDHTLEVFGPGIDLMSNTESSDNSLARDDLLNSIDYETVVAIAPAELDTFVRNLQDRLLEDLSKALQ